MKRLLPTPYLVATFFLVLTTSSHAECNASEASRSLGQGMLYANMNDYGNAIRAFKTSINCKKSSQAYSNLGAAYMQQGKTNLAMDALKNAEKQNAHDNVVMYNLAALNSLADRTDVALQYLDRALGAGFNQYDAIRFDPDLQNLRGEPEFRTILEKHKVFIQ